MHQRLLSPSTAALLVVVATLAPRAASAAEPSSAEAKPTAARPWAPPHEGRRWSLVATASYVAPVSDIFGLELDPFRFGVGARAAYTLPVGVWFGLYGELFQGAAIQQTYHPPLTLIEQDLTAESRAALFGADVGYDQQVGPIVLRYVVGLGVTVLAYDFGAIPYEAFAGYSPMSGSVAGLHFDMGAGVVLPLGPLEFGIEALSRVETSAQIPGSAGGRLVLGGRL